MEGTIVSQSTGHTSVYRILIGVRLLEVSDHVALGGLQRNTETGKIRLALNMHPLNDDYI